MYHPLRSLEEGNWFKLICGASFQHLPAVRNLALAYTLAGTDCIDVAADPAVIAVAQEGIQAARRIAHLFPGQWIEQTSQPWLMVSLNDGEDPHFRKAEFEAALCPEACDRPCERICPVGAIIFGSEHSLSGVVDTICYGCGRCLPVCPVQHITTRSYVSTPAAIAPLVLSGVDAVEIHTQVGRFDDFKRLWQAIAPSLNRLQLIAISCPDGEDLVDYLWALYDLISPLPCPLIWQADGRPMSGDIGDGATRATVKLGQKVLASNLPGYVQLAGGTNRHTVPKLRQLRLLKEPVDRVEVKPTLPELLTDSVTPHPTGRFISGVAYGSYARTLLSPVLDQLEELDGQTFEPSNPSGRSPLFEAGFAYSTGSTRMPGSVLSSRIHSTYLERNPPLLQQAVALASSLVSPLKQPLNWSCTHPNLTG